MKFSVIIPTYDRDVELLRAVRSVLTQTHPNLEVIVVDDAGRIDARQELAVIEDERLRVHRLDANGGANRARNHGISVSTGHILCFLDSDDEWEPNRLADLLSHIESVGGDQPAIFSCKLKFQRSVDYFDVKPAVTIRPDERVFTYLMCNDGLLQTSTLAYARDFGDALRFDESHRVHDDYGLVIRAQDIGFRFLVDEKANAIWHQENNRGRVSIARNRKKYLDWYRDYKKYMNRNERIAYKFVHISKLYDLSVFFNAMKCFIFRAMKPKKIVLYTLRAALPLPLYLKACLLIKSSGVGRFR